MRLMINAINAVFLDYYSVTLRCDGKETAIGRITVGKTLLHIVNDVDVFLKNLLHNRSIPDFRFGRAATIRT